MIALIIENLYMVYFAAFNYSWQQIALDNDEWYNESILKTFRIVSCLYLANTELTFQYTFKRVANVTF